MKEQCKFKESCAFKNNIAEITSISLECNYDVNKNLVNGTFLIEGSYRTHELSINQDNYSFKLPFDYQLPENTISDSVNLNVLDFTYTTNENNLNIEIEYEVNYEVENEIKTKEEFDRFLEDHEVEVVDLNDELPSEDAQKDEQKITEYLSDERIIPEDDIEQEEPAIKEATKNTNDIEIKENINTDANVNVTNTIISSINERDNEYITYHVYICTEYDTLNSIAEKFKVSLDILKSYNDIDTITAGMKIIIPASNDEN